MKTFIVIILIPLAVFSQNNRFSVSLSQNFTTSAKIFLYPNSSDLTIRNSSFSIEDIFNAGLEFKYAISSDLFLGLNIEYMNKTSSEKNLTIISNNLTETISVQDGFYLIPIEFSLYYRLAFSTNTVRFFIFGGTGFYYGNHIREFGDVSISNVKRKFAYGIQVGFLTEYFLTKNFSINGGMKFRDPQFSVTNKYDNREVNFEGSVVYIPQDEFDSKINIEGILFFLSASIHFNL